LAARVQRKQRVAIANAMKVEPWAWALWYWQQLPDGDKKFRVTMEIMPYLRKKADGNEPTGNTIIVNFGASNG
jgi:hypothetical protein